MRGPKNAFQRRMREGMDGDNAGRVYDHITRPVREDDKVAFQHMDAKTRYSDLPEHLRRYRADIFDDKYKRLDENGLSRTITAHIAKDGYWYIHPRDNRTLTVREAARLQTFPDRYRFAGPPSAAFRQIGNAVPPFVGEQLGLAIRDSLDDPHPAGPSTQRNRQRARGVVPRSSQTGRPVAAGVHPLAGDLRRDSPGTSRRPAASVDLAAGPALGERLATPWRLRDELAGDRPVGRPWRPRQAPPGDSRAPGRHAAGAGQRPDDPCRAWEVSRQSRTWRSSLCRQQTDDDDSEEPVLAGRGVLRVASRFTGEETLERKNRMSDGRLAVARMIGYGDNARDAHLGLIELAAAVCRPEVRGLRCVPACGKCASSPTQRSALLALPGVDSRSSIQARGSWRCRVPCLPAQRRYGGMPRIRRLASRPPAAPGRRRCEPDWRGCRAGAEIG